jgi:hypothetical protein
MNYHSAPRKIPEEQKSHLDRGKSLKSRICVDDYTLILNNNPRIKVISDSEHYCIVILKCTIQTLLVKREKSSYQAQKLITLRQVCRSSRPEWVQTRISKLIVLFLVVA